MDKVTPDNFALYNADCLEVMPTLETGSIDCIIADLPYGITNCPWDSVIPLEPLWEQYKRLIKSNGAIVLFGSQPFTSKLVMSNLKMFKYELIWDKRAGGAFVLAHKRVLPAHENILLFSHFNKYNPQITIKPVKDRRPKKQCLCTNRVIKTSSGMAISSNSYTEDQKYPISILSYSKHMGECNSRNRLHPTQKPVALIEYLIKTYTNPGEVVLDNVMGSATTGVACVNTGRAFIGIEKELNYFNIVVERIKKARTDKAEKEAQKLLP